MALHAGPLLATHGTPGLYLAMLWLDTQPGILVWGERGGHGLACRDTRSCACPDGVRVAWWVQLGGVQAGHQHPRVSPEHLPLSPWLVGCSWG